MQEGSARGLQYGEAGPGDGEGLGTGGPSPTHPGPPWQGADGPRWVSRAGAVSGGRGDVRELEAQPVTM